MSKNGSWNLFIIALGLFFIVYAPSMSNPLILIIGGSAVALFGLVRYISGLKAEKAVKKESRNQ